MALVATKVKGGDLTNDVVISAFSIKVYAIYLYTHRQSLPVSFNLVDADGNIIITYSSKTIFADPDPIEIEETWVADNGLTISSSSQRSYCVVFYSDDGV